GPRLERLILPPRRIDSQQGRGRFPGVAVDCAVKKNWLDAEYAGRFVEPGQGHPAGCAAIDRACIFADVVQPLPRSLRRRPFVSSDAVSKGQPVLVRW